MWLDTITHIHTFLHPIPSADSTIDQNTGGVLSYLSGALNVTFIGLFLTEQIYPKGIVRRQQKELDDLREVYGKEVIPALIKVADVLEALPDSEAEVVRQLRQASRSIKDLTRRLDERGDD